MALMKVLKFPNPVLRKKCEEVATVDEGIKKLVRDMTETIRIVFNYY